MLYVTRTAHGRDGETKGREKDYIKVTIDFFASSNRQSLSASHVRIVTEIEIEDKTRQRKKGKREKKSAVTPSSV